MIASISAEHKTSFQPQELPTPTPIYPPPSSTLSSLKEKGRERFLLIRWMTGLFSIIKNLLSCFFSNHTPSQSQATPSTIATQLHTPEISPSSLSDSPFKEKVFTFPEEGKWELRGKELYKFYTEMFFILGRDGPWTWYQKQQTLFDLEEKLLDPNATLHPLEILYFLFHNKKKTEQVAHFKSQVETTVMQTVMWLTGRSNPWAEFLEKQEIRFRKQKSTVASMLPGFCSALKLNEKDLLSFIKDKKWQALTSFVYESRKKHFNI